jgi:hypothetical protein
MGRAGRYRRSPVSPGRLGGSVCSPGTAARRRSSIWPPSRPPDPRPACPASTSRSHAPGRTSVPGPGRLCRLPGTLARCQDWRDSHLRFRFDDQLQPLPDIGDLLREADRDPIAVVGREPVQAEASGQRRDLTLPLPVGACPRSLFPWVVTAPGSRGLRGIIPGKPEGRDLAEVAPGDLPINPLGTVRPHPGAYRLLYFFSNIFFELRSPVTESNRRPSPYHGDALPTELTGPVSTADGDELTVLLASRCLLHCSRRRPPTTPAPAAATG